MQLQGKSVLITGGTGALGSIVAAKFAEEGANVAASYLSEIEMKALPEAYRSTIDCFRADVTRDEEVKGLFQAMIERHKRVDVLINLVGGFLPFCTVGDTETKDWLRMININLNSMFLCCREFLRRLGTAPYGRIISIAAMPALKPVAGRGPYAVAKRGVMTLTEVLGEELKGTGITANCIAPGIIKTTVNMNSMPDEDHSKWVLPEDLAAMMLFLCSPAGKAINGACIPLFGGI